MCSVFAHEALSLLTQSKISGSFFKPAVRLICLVRLGEAFTLEHEYEKAEEHLLGVLKLAGDLEQVLATLETLMAIAELRQGQGKEHQAREILTGVVSHSASTSELALRASEALDGLAGTPFHPEGGEVSLAKMITLAVHGADVTSDV